MNDPLNSGMQGHGSCHPLHAGTGRASCRESHEKIAVILRTFQHTGHPHPVLSRPVRTRTLNSIFQAAHQFITPVRNATRPMMSPRKRIPGLSGKRAVLEHFRVGRATPIFRRRLTSSTVTGQAAVSYGYSPNGNLITKGSDTLGYTNYRVTSATIKGGSRSYAYDNAGHVLSDGKRTYQWTSFGQLKEVYQASTPQLETFAATGTFAPEIAGIASWVQYQQSQAKATSDFDAGGSRSRQTMVRTYADTSEASVVTRYLGSYELEANKGRQSLGELFLSIDRTRELEPGDVLVRAA